MNSKLKKYLLDIDASIGLIQDYMHDKSFEDYTEDIGLRDKVERRLSIIGEAVKKYTDLNPVYPIHSSKRIIGFRNLIIHRYDAVDHTVVWSILKVDLPGLRKQVRELLAV